MISVDVKKKKLTIKELVNFAQKFIPSVEAEYLAMGFFGLKRSELYLSGCLIEPKTAIRFLQLIKRTRANVPLQYLVNSVQFCDLDLFIDHRAFIPRPETEELVLRTQTRVKNPEIIVDYGTGSGCIAIVLARVFPRAQIIGVDISQSALEVARINITRYRLTKQIRLIRSWSLRAPNLQFLKNRVDLFISNPPYIPKERLNHIPKRVSKYEPKIALNGGPRGISIIAMIVSQAPEFIKSGGLLAMEIDDTHSDFIMSQLTDSHIETDIYGKKRYVFWQKRKL